MSLNHTLLPVPAHLFLDENDLLLTPHHEITAGIVGTLVQLFIKNVFKQH